MKKFDEHNYVIFSINIEQIQNKKNIWKKKIKFPKKWASFTLKNSYINIKYNGFAMLTGKINDIIIIDIDDTNHWKQLLKENNEQEPITAKVITGGKYREIVNNLPWNQGLSHKAAILVTIIEIWDLANPRLICKQ